MSMTESCSHKNSKTGRGYRDLPVVVIYWDHMCKGTAFVNTVSYSRLYASRG
jgi:hypothetical protein